MNIFLASFYIYFQDDFIVGPCVHVDDSRLREKKKKKEENRNRLEIF